MHSVAVCALMVALRPRAGSADEACREAGLAGLLHDLGKAAMPLDVLNKPGKLTDDEFELMKPTRCAATSCWSRRGGGPMRARRLPLAPRAHGRHGYPHGLPPSASASSPAWARCATSTTPSPPTAPTRTPGTRPRRSRDGLVEGHFDPACSRPSSRAWASTRWARWSSCIPAAWRWWWSRTRKSLATPTGAACSSRPSRTCRPAAALDLARSNDKIVSREDPKTWGFPQLDELWAGDLAPKRG
jgi:hypothetical protein